MGLLQCFTCMQCGDRDSSTSIHYKREQPYCKLFAYCSRCFDDLIECFPKCMYYRKAITPSQAYKGFFLSGT